MGDDPNTAETTDSRKVAVEGRLRTLLLGTNAWLVVYLIPALHGGSASFPTSLLATWPLLALALGVSWLGRRESPSRWLLLGIFPTSVAAAVALQGAETYDPITALVGGLSLLAYLAAAAHASSRPLKVKPTTIRAASAKEPVAEPARRRWTRRALLAASALGSLAIVAVAPTWVSEGDRASAWGEAAEDGAVLTVVVAMVIAAFALGALVGPSLRAERRPRRDLPGRRRRRIAAAMLVGTAAAMGWLVLHHFDAAG